MSSTAASRASVQTRPNQSRTAGSGGWIDVLMVTYRSPEYVRLSLDNLLRTADERTRVWLWHNGTHEETLDVVRAFLGHPRVHRFHHSLENVRLREPTNWLWREADGEFVSKVDDDCLEPPEWIETLRKAHQDFAGFGVLGTWRFYPEDFRPDAASRKIGQFPGGHRVMRNLWVQGSGYLLRRSVVEEIGPLREGQSFTQYCIDSARRGWVNGWYYPFLFEEHMDDPRSPNSLLRSDADLLERLPLSARQNGVRTLDDWTAQMRRSAEVAQTAPLDPRHFLGWRAKRRAAKRRIQRLVTGRTTW
jgi:glycosyltransferase involved in cell wall biosynthesis